MSMLTFTGKYGTGSLYFNNCVQDLESFLYLKLYSTMILVNAGMGNKYSTFRVPGTILPMLAFTFKYGTNDLDLNKYTHTIKINYAKVSV